MQQMLFSLKAKWQFPFFSWLILGLAILLIYLLTASQQYDADVLPELKRINQLDTRESDPAHMLYIRMGIPFYRAWLAMGYQEDALVPMQILNAFFGAGTIMVFVLVLRHFAVRWPLALLTSSAVAFSYAFWTHTVDAFFIIPASFFAITALYFALILSISNSSSGRIIIAGFLGLSLALALLAYQSNLALIPSLLVASWSTNKKQSSNIVKAWLIAVVILVMVAGTAWLYQAVLLADVQSPIEFVDWFLFNHGGIRDGLWRREGVNLLRALPIAWLATILPLYEGLRLQELVQSVISPDRLSAQIALLLLFLCLLSVVSLLLRRPSILRSRGFPVAVLWFLVPGLAVAWFDPAEVKLWLIPMFGFWLFFALILSSPFHAKFTRHITLIFMVPLIALIAISNFLVPVWNNHRLPSRNMITARQAARYLHKDDVLISAGFDWTKYLSYISDDFHVFNAVDVAQFQGKGIVKSRLVEVINSAWLQGRRVFIVDYFGPTHEEFWTEWITPNTTLSTQDFTGYERTSYWLTASGKPMWELKPLQ